MVGGASAIMVVEVANKSSIYMANQLNRKSDENNMAPAKINGQHLISEEIKPQYSIHTR